MVTIITEWVVMTDDYEFTISSPHKNKDMNLNYRKARGKDKNKKPTYSEIFEVVKDIFSQMDKDELKSIYYAFEEKDYIFYRETKELEFFKFMFGDKTI